MKLQNYICGNWTEGQGEGQMLFNAVNGETIASASSDGLDFAEVLNYGRTKGGSALSKMTFHERARALKALALYLLEKKDHYYQLSFKSGATKIDSWIDIEGGIGNLFVMSSKGRREMPDSPFYVDGKPEILSKEGSFIGHHLFVPKKGIAVHINAFNFPIWGMLEKIAVNLLAGVPAVVKPATATSYLTEAMVKDIIASGILPEGSLQLICGSARTLLDHVKAQDVVTFTGSASTAQLLKKHPRMLSENVPFNIEADSLNCCILGEDVTPDMEEFNIFIKEVSKEMTVKAGQKCTAVRRIIVPENRVDEVGKALAARLDKVVIGDPLDKDVRMGSLASRDQLDEVSSKVAELSSLAKMIYSRENLELKGGSKDKGAFISPTLFYCDRPFEKTAVHEIEAFGPVSTIVPYKSTSEAVELANMGRGSLVGSVVTADDNIATEIVLGASPWHGRMLVLNKDCAKESTGHGSPMPQLVHGGPGRAGGGEEMGGLRGVFHYMQRTAIQGSPTTLSKITGVYQPKAKQTKPPKHPFRLHFEELEVGHTHTTHKRTITETDIVNFANVSWDHFYAHTDTTSLEGSFFEQRVAHGYFIISAAAGLFVDPGKGPVLANYGLDELRFIKPVYAGATIFVKLTVKEKIDQENKPEDRPRGIVKWQVEVFDETEETVALGTILTLVAKL
jgi:oxepin-CoA hydrolase/3-oxo-5,6-dehydrosuberyl-CoA semialdehyde dehydrogenase